MFGEGDAVVGCGVAVAVGLAIDGDGPGVVAALPPQDTPSRATTVRVAMSEERAAPRMCRMIRKTSSARFWFPRGRNAI